MAPESGRESPAVSQRLFHEPYRFDFFQAVRLLEQLAVERAAGKAAQQRAAVGHDRAPSQEVVRFCALPALSFPAGTVAQLRSAEKPDGPPEMLVTFLGLTGPGGVLPQHYTTLLLQRLRYRDHSLRDFLDLFNHRIISLFYRAWEKYRFPISWERALQESAGDITDLFTQCLYSLTGLGTGGLRGRLAIDDSAILFYGGFFSRMVRPAVCLEQILTEHFQVPVTIEQFEGQWLSLSEDDQTQLAGLGWPDGRNTRLGFDMVAGDRIWDVQSKIRLRVGPMSYERFQRLLPSGSDWPAFVQMARAYLGPELDFDVQLVLQPLEVPWWQLTPDEDEGLRLGWDAWGRSHDFLAAVEDVIFTVENA